MPKQIAAFDGVAVLPNRGKTGIVEPKLSRAIQQLPVGEWVSVRVFQPQLKQFPAANWNAVFLGAGVFVGTLFGCWLMSSAFARPIADWLTK